MSKILRIKGKQSGDYFDIVCEKCETLTKNEYLGWDPSIPRFKATCEKCKTSTILKLGNWTDLPREPSNIKAKIRYQKQKEKKLLQYFETLTPEEQKKLTNRAEYLAKQRYSCDHPGYRPALEKEKFEQIDSYKKSNS